VVVLGIVVVRRVRITAFESGGSGNVPKNERTFIILRIVVRTIVSATKKRSGFFEGLVRIVFARRRR
jgi:hypothetical protein